MQVTDSDHFIEFSQSGFSTKFTITNRIENKLLEFHLENVNLSGNWMGEFEKTEISTVVKFTERVEVKNFIMNAFVKM